MLFAVLVCVGVALALTMTAMQTSLQQRRHLSRTLQLEQTRILLDAAEGSKPFKQWVADQEGAVEFKPLKMTLELPTGKAAAISATAVDEESFLLTALIGDADNEISVTRRSRSVGKDD
jgi:type II secretory pathway pseudopilin PulG